MLWKFELCSFCRQMKIWSHHRNRWLRSNSWRKRLQSHRMNPNIGPTYRLVFCWTQTFYWRPDLWSQSDWDDRQISIYLRERPKRHPLLSRRPNWISHLNGPILSVLKRQQILLSWARLTIRVLLESLPIQMREKTHIHHKSTQKLSKKLSKD